MLAPLSLADVEIAIDIGDADTLARYLRETPPASLEPVVIRNIADMLSPRTGFEETWRLKFCRPQAGRTKNEIAATVKQASIAHQVEAELQELRSASRKRVSDKIAIGRVANRTGKKDGTVRKIWQAHKKRQ